jgi:hypothetical protein
MLGPVIVPGGDYVRRVDTMGYRQLANVCTTVNPLDGASINWSLRIEAVELCVMRLSPTFANTD